MVSFIVYGTIFYEDFLYTTLLDAERFLELLNDATTACSRKSIS